MASVCGRMVGRDWVLVSVVDSPCTRANGRDGVASPRVKRLAVSGWDFLQREIGNREVNCGYIIPANHPVSGSPLSPVLRVGRHCVASVCGRMVGRDWVLVSVVDSPCTRANGRDGVASPRVKRLAVSGWDFLQREIGNREVNCGYIIPANHPVSGSPLSAVVRVGRHCVASVCGRMVRACSVQPSVPEVILMSLLYN